MFASEGVGGARGGAAIFLALVYLQVPGVAVVSVNVLVVEAARLIQISDLVRVLSCLRGHEAGTLVEGGHCFEFSISLSAFIISPYPNRAIKSQIIVYFLSSIG